MSNVLVTGGQVLLPTCLPDNQKHALQLESLNYMHVQLISDDKHLTQTNKTQTHLIYGTRWHLHLPDKGISHTPVRASVEQSILGEISREPYLLHTPSVYTYRQYMGWAHYMHGHWPNSKHHETSSSRSCSPSHCVAIEIDENGPSLTRTLQAIPIISLKKNENLNCKVFPEKTMMHLHLCTSPSTFSPSTFFVTHIPPLSCEEHLPQHVQWQLPPLCLQQQRRLPQQNYSGAYR